jgi:hypothetical protein
MVSETWISEHRDHRVARLVGTDEVTGSQVFSLHCVDCGQWYVYDELIVTPAAPR